MSGADWWDHYEGVIFDLDGTLVRLDVDWRAVDAELVELLRDAGVDREDYHAWELLDAAEALGLGSEAEAVIARHEENGAQNCDRLPLADRLLDIDRPLGVVSLNAVQAVRTALEAESLLEAVDVVIGRGSVPERKPKPEPLLAALEELDVDPAAAVFVGDSEGDATTAQRAGVDFRSVEELAGEPAGGDGQS